MSRNNLRKRLAWARVAYIIWSIVWVIAFWGILSFALSGSTDKEIPEDTGTLGAALNAIIGPDWQTGTLAKVAARLGWVEADYYVRMDSPAGLVCGDVWTLSGLLTRIEQNGSIGCAQQLPNGSTILRPILATIRDLDASCYGQVTVQNASGTTYSPSNSDPVDIYEGDTITTTPLCAMASLYFIDHSIVRLAPSTVLALRSAWTAGGSGSTDVTLSGGELWARVFKPITDDSYFNVSTEESSVGVRGTSLYVSRKKPGTLYETKIVAVDTGLASATGQVAQLSLSGSTGSIISLKLAQAVTVQKPLYSPSATITASSTSNSATIYQTFPFTRISTMEDLHDFDTLRAWVGNLPTIAMTGGWLHGKDIYSTWVVQTAINGIDKTTQKVADEINRTDPNPNGANPNLTAEETKICSTVSAVGAILREIQDAMSHEIRCSSSNILALVDREKWIQVANNSFIPKNTNGGFDIGNISANGGLIKNTGSSWTLSLSGSYTPTIDPTTGNFINQHLINIGSELIYVRIYTEGNDLKLRVPTYWWANSVTETILSNIPNNTLMSIFISRDGTWNYTIKVINSTTNTQLWAITKSWNSIPIQTLFVGDTFSFGNPWWWSIQNIKISK